MDPAAYEWAGKPQQTDRLYEHIGAAGKLLATDHYIPMLYTLGQAPMKKELTNATTPPIFEQIKRLDEYGVEYWSARDLSKAFEYLEYRNFQPAIERAKEACQNSGQNMANHFVDIHEMIMIGSKAERLFLRNELRRHNAQLADVAKNAGVIDAVDYAIFQNFGYQGLYGGLNARDIHTQKGLKKSQHLLDHMNNPNLFIKEWIGNISILEQPKTAFLCSRRVPADAVLKCYDWAIQMREAGRCVISGFHSPLEKDVLHYLLKGKQPVIMALARGLKKTWEPEGAGLLRQRFGVVVLPPGNGRGPFDAQWYRASHQSCYPARTGRAG